MILSLDFWKLICNKLRHDKVELVKVNLPSLEKKTFIYSVNTLSNLSIIGDQKFANFGLPLKDKPKYFNGYVPTSHPRRVN